MDINYIASIDQTTGRIIQLLLPQADILPEGVVDGVRTVYLTEWNIPVADLAMVIDNYWFDTTRLEFIEVGPPPNNFCTWDLTTSSWTWDTDAVLQQIRSKRFAMLMTSDWTQVSDNTLTDAQREEARTYRTALRNITSSLDNPENVEDVTWPTPPSFL